MADPRVAALREENQAKQLEAIKLGASPEDVVSLSGTTPLHPLVAALLGSAQAQAAPVSEQQVWPFADDVEKTPPMQPIMQDAWPLTVEGSQQIPPQQEQYDVSSVPEPTNDAPSAFPRALAGVAPEAVVTEPRQLPMDAAGIDPLRAMQGGVNPLAELEQRAADVQELQRLEDEIALETLEAEIAAEEGGTLSSAEPDTRSPNPEDYNWWDKTKDIAGGAPQAGRDFLDAVPAVLNFTGDMLDNRWEGAISLPPYTTFGTKKENEDDIFPLQIPNTKTFEPVETAFDYFTDRRVPEGVSPVTDFGRTGMEWASGGLRKAGAAIAKPTIEAFKKLIPDTVIGLSAATGEQVGGEPGEVIGGLLGLANTFRGGKGSYDDVAKIKAVEYIKRSITDSDELALALKNLETNLAAGKKGTLAELTDNPEMYNIEKTLTTGKSEGSKAALALKDEQQASLEQARQQFDPSPTGAELPPEDLIRVADENAARTTQGIDDATQAKIAAADAAEAAATTAYNKTTKGLEQATGRATAEADEVLRPVTESRIRSTINTERGAAVTDQIKQLKEKASEGWKAFEDAAGTTELDKILTDVEILKSKLPDDAVADLDAKFSKFFNRMDEWGSEVDDDALQYAVSHMNTEISNAFAGNSGTVLDKMMGDINKVLEEALDEVPNYAAAKAGTKTLKEAENTGLAKAVKLDPNTASTTFTGPQGATTAAEIEKLGPKVKELTAESLRAEARFLPDGVTKEFIMANEDFFSQNPKLFEEFTRYAEVTDARKLAEKTEKTGTKMAAAELAEKKALAKAARSGAATEGSKLKQAAAKTPMGKYAAAPNKDTYVDKLINNAAARNTELADLYKALDAEGAGDMLKSRVMKRMADEVFKGNKITENSLAKYNNAKIGLENSGLLKTKEIEDLDKLTKQMRIHYLQRSKNAGLAQPPSLTASDRLVASGLAAVITGGLGGGRSLIIAGAVRRQISNKLQEAKYDDKTAAAVAEYMTNPSKFMKDINNKMTNSQIADQIMIRLNAYVQASTEDEE